VDRSDAISISADAVYARLGTTIATLLLDVREPIAFATAGAQIVSAVRRPPADAQLWCAQLPRDRIIVLYCQDGTGNSAELTQWLIEGGIEAFILQGGIDEWRRLGVTHAAADRTVPDAVGDARTPEFDAFLTLSQISDVALDRLAVIVRGAYTGKPELTSQSPGPLALTQGLSLTIGDDMVQLEHGMIVHDALYAWCRVQSDGAPSVQSRKA
jgi:rhodanese-related sulfurtransferase